MASFPRSLVTGLKGSPIVRVLMSTYASWRADRAIRLGAALAYYALFAIVPLVSSAIAVAGILFSESEIKGFLAERLDTVLASTDLDVVSADLAGTIDASGTIGALTVLGVVAGVFAASLVFVALQDAFNMIWNVPVGRGLLNSVRRRFVAVAVVFLFGALLVASLSVQAIALLLDEWFPGQIPALDRVNDVFVTLGTWALGVAALVFLFQLLIRKHLAWRDVVIASTVTGVMLVAGTWLLSLYFRNWGSTSLSGVAGSLLLLLAWLYYQAQILIGGAELLKTLDEGGAGSGSTRQAAESGAE